MYHHGLAHLVAVFTGRFGHAAARNTHRTSEIEPEYTKVDGADAGKQIVPDTLLGSRIWHQSRISCPRCAKNQVTRAPRLGMKERVLSAAYVYPFTCRSCGYRFRWLVWGKRYTRARRKH